MNPGPDLFKAPSGPMPAGPKIDVEVWISRRLLRSDLFAGVTTPEERRERVRRAIVDGELEEAIAGKRKDASCETWSQLFERVYGQPVSARAAA